METQEIFGNSLIELLAFEPRLMGLSHIHRAKTWQLVKINLA